MFDVGRWMLRASVMLRYLRNLSKPRLILWSYAIWYLTILIRYFDPSPHLWFTSIGLSGIIGFALLTSTRVALREGSHLEGWGVFRLFLMPFCVSSFAALVKGHGFILIFSPVLTENCFALILCAILWTVVLSLQRAQRIKINS